MIHFFTNAYKGNASDTIALNSDQVVSVFEAVFTNPDTNELIDVTNIFVLTGTVYSVEEPILEVVSRLNSSN